MPKHSTALPFPFNLERQELVEPMALGDARKVWAQIRQSHGFKPDHTTRILKDSGNAKLDAEMSRGGRKIYVSHTLNSGRVNGTCVNDAHCASDCVVQNSDRARAFDAIRRARQSLTDLVLFHPDAHAALLLRDLKALGAKARRTNASLRVRLNTNSDIAYERYMPAVLWETIAEYGYAYDYTKRIDRVGHVVPGAYRTSFSATSSTGLGTVRRLLGRGDTVTMVLPVPKGGHIPTQWHGLPMVNGDTSDDRSADPSGVLVGLTAKGELLKRWRSSGVWGPLVTTLARKHGERVAA